MHLAVYRRMATLRSSVRASGQRHRTRTHLYASVSSDGHIGWGEVSPQPFSLNGDPSYNDVVNELEVTLLPLVRRIIETEQTMPNWSRIVGISNATAASRTATTLLEMALFDRFLRSTNQPLSGVWPPRFATPSLHTVSALDDQWPELTTPSHVRLKVNAAPLTDAVLERLHRSAIDVMLDYNCCEPTREAVLIHCEQIASVTELRALEQPYAAGNVVDHALLRAVVDAPLSLDEGVRTRRDIDHLVQYGAADVVCIKPARVGGYSVARSLIDHAHSKGLRAYVGGFFESALARTMNRHLAESLVSEPSDIDGTQLLDGGDWNVGDLGLGIAPSESMSNTFECIYADVIDLGSA